MTNKALPSKTSPSPPYSWRLHWLSQTLIKNSQDPFSSSGAHIWIRQLKIWKFLLKPRLTENNESEFACLPNVTKLTTGSFRFKTKSPWLVHVLPGTRPYLTAAALQLSTQFHTFMKNSISGNWSAKCTVLYSILKSSNATA